MVNAHRLKILEILREGKTVSGAEMAAQLELSRVAVWKHIGRLEEAGFVIESSASGYTLISESDAPIPEAFGKDGNRIEYLAEVPSTMDKAREAAFAGCPAGAVFIAEQQSAGRGRDQRTWLSEAGGLYFTLVDRPALHPRYAAMHAVKAAVALCRVLREKWSVPAVFKWPNDIYADGKKLAGILSEYFVQGNRISFANLGTGVNVHNRPALDAAENLDRLSKRTTSRSGLLQDFLKEFSSPWDIRELRSEANSYSMLKNRKIRARTYSGTAVNGIAGEISADGYLAIHTDAVADRLSGPETEIIHIEGIR